MKFIITLKKQAVTMWLNKNAYYICSYLYICILYEHKDAMPTFI